MINANEARRLVHLSDRWVDHHLTRLDEQIRKLAEDGKTTLDVHDTELMVTVKDKNSAQTTPLMQKLAEKIRSHGYTTKFVTEERKPFRSFDDDAPPTPNFIHFIRIYW